MCIPPVGTHSASGLLTALCRQSAALDWGSSARHTTRPSGCAQVAQLAEQGTENPRVGGSIPPLGTNSAELPERSSPTALIAPYPAVEAPMAARHSYNCMRRHGRAQRRYYEGPPPAP